MSTDNDIDVSDLELDEATAASWNGPQDFGDGTATIRTYAKGSVYVFPTDKGEGGRQAIKHRLVKHLFGDTNFRGVSESQLCAGISVLDVGYGTGMWLSEMSRDFPKGNYFGVDIVTSEWANAFQKVGQSQFGVDLHFLTGDVLQTLPFPDNTFDYVHQQSLGFSIPAARWPHVISELHRVLKPSGWIDLVEIDPLQKNTTPRLDKLHSMYTSIFTARGLDFTIPENLHQIIGSDSRFESVEHLHPMQSVGWEDNEVSRLWYEDHREFLLGGAPFMAEAMMISQDEFETLLRYVCEDWISAKSCATMHRTWARKRHII
ncbi:S-adenosyl-L-methionine-dependent methyltransferase [Cladochytrium replicatum]|nr:S-adenosyl-L-methionine-dependent methyltransferase [Cladochytrium replicatum]